MPKAAPSALRSFGRRASIEGQLPPTVAMVTRRQRLDGARTRRRGHPPEVSDRFERGLMLFGKPREGGTVSEARRGRLGGRSQGDFRGLSARCSRPCATLTRPPNAPPRPPQAPHHARVTHGRTPAEGRLRCIQLELRSSWYVVQLTPPACTPVMTVYAPPRPVERNAADYTCCSPCGLTPCMGWLRDAVGAWLHEYLAKVQKRAVKSSLSTPSSTCSARAGPPTDPRAR